MSLNVRGRRESFMKCSDLIQECAKNLSYIDFDRKQWIVSVQHFQEVGLLFIWPGLKVGIL